MRKAYRSPLRKGVIECNREYRFFVSVGSVCVAFVGEVWYWVVYRVPVLCRRADEVTKCIVWVNRVRLLWVFIWLGEIILDPYQIDP